MKKNIIIFFGLVSFFVNHQNVFADDSQGILHSFQNTVIRYLPKPGDQVFQVLSGWQRETSGSSQQVIVPFLFEKLDALSISASFKLDSTELQKKIYLVFPELFGAVHIYVNDKSLQFFINSDISRSVLLDPGNLKFNTDNQLKIEMKIPVRPEDGFPSFVHLFAEPRFLGLLKPVYLISKSQNYINQFQYTLSQDTDPAIFNYSFNFELNTVPEEQSKDQFNIDYSISSTQGRLYHRRIKRIKIGGNHLSDELKIPKEQFWSVEQPNSLVLSYTLANGNRFMTFDTTSISIRTTNFVQNNFYLNSSKIEIKGVNYHRNLQSFEDQNYYGKLKNDLTGIKDLGFNAVRCPSYIPDDQFLSLTDSLGLLVFGELPIRRYPNPLFLSDVLLENVKITLDRVSEIINAHPSFYALGIGQEIMLNEGSVQKFILIAKSYAMNKITIPVYTSPVPGSIIPSNRVTDFYILDKYNPLQFSELSKNMIHAPFTIAGMAGIINSDQTNTWDTDPANKQRLLFISNEISALKASGLKGGFLECYQDWIATNPTNVTVNNKNPLIMPDGFSFINGEMKPWIKSTDNIWDISQNNTVGKEAKKQITNYFSILMVFASIIFLLIYSKRPRLKENMKRAFKHPYGFFVDMRERRIIPLFNSFLVGAFTALILGNYIGSVFYYYRDSFWMQEVFNLLLEPIGLFEYFLKASKSPVSITLTFFVILFLFPIIVSIILYIISLFSKERIRFRQGLAIGLWSGIPLFFLLPLSIFGYHWLYYFENNYIFFIVLGLFIFWAHFRIINGIRVLFITKTTKVFLIMVLSYIAPVIILWAVFRPEPYWYDYFKLLLNAKALF